MTSKKIATSIPSEQYRALERTRRNLKLNRSEAVQRALGLWLASQETDARIEQYVRGYLSKPEDAAAGTAYVSAWASGLASEEW